MKRFVIALALMCALSPSIFAGDMPAGGRSEPPPPGNMPTDGKSESSLMGDMPAVGIAGSPLLVDVVIAIITQR